MAVTFVDAEVVYDGRSRSRLARGRYLIVEKSDGSILIHGSKLTKPKNYLGPGSKIQWLPTGVRATNRGESLEITVYAVLGQTDTVGWSDEPIVLERTERELATKLVAALPGLLGRTLTIEQERPTSAGPIDVLATAEDGTLYVFVVKRNRAQLAACSQLQRYLDCLEGTRHGYVVSPEITKNALRWLTSRGFNWLQFGFDS